MRNCLSNFGLKSHLQIVGVQLRSEPASCFAKIYLDFYTMSKFVFFPHFHKTFRGREGHLLNSASSVYVLYPRGS